MPTDETASVLFKLLSRKGVLEVAEVEEESEEVPDAKKLQEELNTFGKEYATLKVSRQFAWGLIHLS